MKRTLPVTTRLGLMPLGVMPLGVMALLLSLPLLLGCGASGPPLEDAPSADSGRASLTVVVWSEQLQDSVRAVGSLVSLSDGAERVVDTSADPEAGHTFRDLPPGRYRVAMKFRKHGTSIEYVAGEHLVYLEPGAAERVTVVVTDRKEEKLGRAGGKDDPNLAAARD